MMTKIFVNALRFFVPLGVFVILCEISTIKGGLSSIFKFYHISSEKDGKLSKNQRKSLGLHFILSGGMTVLAGVIIPDIFTRSFGFGLLVTVICIIALCMIGVHTGKKIGRENKRHILD